MSLLQRCALTIVLIAFTGNAHCDDAEKIEYLLASIANSNCVFIRNGEQYTSEAAVKHLRMKYRRGRRWVTDADSFINRIATKSSLSGKPYAVRCADEATQPTSDWLKHLLSEFSNVSR